MSKALAAGVILITLVSPLAAQDGAKFPTGEDNPWPNGTSKTQIGKLSLRTAIPRIETGTSLPFASVPSSCFRGKGLLTAGANAAR